MQRYWAAKCLNIEGMACSHWTLGKTHPVQSGPQLCSFHQDPWLWLGAFGSHIRCGKGVKERFHLLWHFFNHYTRICHKLCCLYNLSYLILMGFLLTKPFQIHLWVGLEPGTFTAARWTWNRMHITSASKSHPPISSKICSIPYGIHMVPRCHLSWKLWYDQLWRCMAYVSQPFPVQSRLPLRSTA